MEVRNSINYTFTKLLIYNVERWVIMTIIMIHQHKQNINIKNVLIIHEILLFLTINDT